MEELTYVQALNRALREEMTRDPNVFLMGEDIGIWDGTFKVTKGLLADFPGRVIDTPLSESAIIGAGVGAALAGLRPVTELMFMDFATCAMDPIVNQAAKIRFMSGGKNKVPMVIRGPQGGGLNTAAQHSQSLEAWFAHVPGLKVVLPSCAYDAYGLLKAAIRDDNPVVFLESKTLYGTKNSLPEEEFLIELGKADVKRKGKDVSIIAISTAVPMALQAAEELAKEGIDAEVIDPRTISPLDSDTIIESVKKTGRAVVAHEAVLQGGFGAEIASIIVEKAFDYLEASVLRVGSEFSPIPYTKPLETAFLINKDKIVTAVKKLFE
ncbi:MAG TPA: alpha-ketoacid dehydrogenase subunit beta [Anaerovoracaceae bacterium]|nr:alpha-ketoacid dehydrogenase subunit beta [Anaerovoracaceae bacterium]